MTITIGVNANYQSLVGKTLSTQAELLSKLKVAIVDIDLSSESYVTGGIVTNLSLDGRLTSILAVEVLEVSTGDKVEYVSGAGDAASLGLLKIYQTGSLDAPLNEKTNSESTTLTCKLRVFGFTSL